MCYTEQIKNNMDICGFKNKTEIIPLGFDTETFLEQIIIKKSLYHILGE